LLTSTCHTLRRPSFPSLTPDLRLNARPEDLNVAGFSNVVVGARGQPADHRRAILGCCEHDDWNVPDNRNSLNAPTRLLPVNAGHH